MTESDTIAAIATAPGEAGISIVRISGTEALAIADRIFRGAHERPSTVPGGRFLHGQIWSGHSREAVMTDEVVLLVYRAPHSYTREDVVEIQGHGGRICARRILRTVLDNGARPARPGEFTQRAFLNGRIDLPQAEAVADLIGAQSERAAMAAIEQLRGAVSNSVKNIYAQSVDVAADLEATLDFAEEELPESALPDIVQRLVHIEQQIDTLLETWEEGRLLREGALVVISGRPNVGKSSLMNRLLGQARAIVTEIPGTTRDTLEEQLIIDGVPIRLVDTAGLRDSTCMIEREGIRRAEDVIRQADLLLIMLDGSQEVYKETLVTSEMYTKPHRIIIINKIDIVDHYAGMEFSPLPVVRTSMKTGQGVDELKEAIRSSLGRLSDRPAHATISERHRSDLRRSLNALQTCRDILVESGDSLLASAHLRESIEALGELTGMTYSDELLNRIFSKFCIGK